MIKNFFTTAADGKNFSTKCYFDKPPPVRTLEEIRADSLALEQETEGPLGEITGRGK